MFPSPVNSNSSSTCSSGFSQPGDIYCHRGHAIYHQSSNTTPISITTTSPPLTTRTISTTEFNNTEEAAAAAADGRGLLLRPVPCEYQPPSEPKQTSPFLRGPPMTDPLCFLKPISPKPSSSSKKIDVAYIRIWTELYDVYSKVEKCNDIVLLSSMNVPFFQRLLITGTVHITYSENFQLINNMLKLLHWSPECRFVLTARGFCEDFMTFLKTLPPINGIALNDVCSNESIWFDELLELLTNCDELEIDMAHIKYKEDPGEILLKWNRPASLKRFILYNVARGISTEAVQTFCQDKIVPGGVISVTYEKYSKKQQYKAEPSNIAE